MLREVERDLGDARVRLGAVTRERDEAKAEIQMRDDLRSMWKTSDTELEGLIALVRLNATGLNSTGSRIAHALIKTLEERGAIKPHSSGKAV